MQVSILFVVLMFMFAIYGIQVIGGQLARCNDQDPQRYTVRVRNPKSPAGLHQNRDGPKILMRAHGFCNKNQI
jgi:hypothetical protein